MFLLIYLIVFVFSDRISAININTSHIPRLETLYPLPTNNKMEMLAAHFRQNDVWEEGNMPMQLTEAEETKPEDLNSEDVEPIPTKIRNGHLFRTQDFHAYRIDPEGVNPHSEHHIFLVRHGLYFYTEDDPSSHLLRYGKYQARMAGHKINKKIHELMQQLGPLTRPIKLVSSTQTRAFETLYNIRLQLNNNLKFEEDIIQDTGLTECTDPNRQRMRWLYFVREYLQPIKSERREHTITIIAAHGNLLTTYDYIIKQFLARNHQLESFRSFPLPRGVELAHAETLLYRTVGIRPIYFKTSFMMDEIPITVNHAHLRKDFYYEWAAVHQCRSQHGLDEMTNYVRTSILDNVFSTDRFRNLMRDYETIVYVEIFQEYETHLLPMLMRTCRGYLYRLPYIKANTNFGVFNRLSSPVPIPATEEEQRSPLNISFHHFNAYSMPYPVDATIQKFRRDPYMNRQQVPYNSVHPDSRVLVFLLRHDNLNVDTGDEKTSYLTRLGINQIRGVMSHVHSAIFTYRREIPNVVLHPINIIAEPTIQSAETAFHTRNLLIDVGYNVSEQITDLGIQFNYYQKRSVNEFLPFQRVQHLYLLRHYFIPEENNATQPTIQVHIIIGDGRLFTSFRQEMVLSRLLIQPIPRFSTMSDPGFNALKHGHGFFFEGIGDDSIKLHEELTLTGARGIKDNQRIPTEHSLHLPTRELKYWLRSPSGPCTLSYFVEHMDKLSLAVAGSSSVYQRHIASTIKSEWNPYLAGLFIYACRLQLTLATAANTHDQQVITAAGSVAAGGSNEQNPGNSA